MQIQTIKAKIILLCCILSLTACLFRSMPSDEDVLAFYNAYTSELNEVVSICSSHKKIYHVVSGDDEVKPFGGKAFSTEDKIAIERLRVIIADLAMSSVMCNRLYSDAYKFRGVSFYLYDDGLFDGKVKGISFVTPWSLVDSPYLQANIVAGELKKINDDGWFIFDIK